MSVVVFVYSKYSNKSLELLKTIDGVLDFRKLCIDNDEIRRQIVSENNKNKITQVPTIMIIHLNGTIEKHEGAEAFEWVKNTLNSMKRLSEEFLRPKEEKIEEPKKAVVTQSVTTEQEPSELIEPKAAMHVEQDSDVSSLKQIKNDKNLNIHNVAAMLQAEREREDEKNNPQLKK